MSEWKCRGMVKLKELRRKNGLKPTLFRQEFRTSIDDLRIKKAIEHG